VALVAGPDVRVGAVPAANQAGTPAPEVPPGDRDHERTRVAKLLEAHAPADWQEHFRADELLDAIIDGEPIQMFVMAADIRSSTLLMKEAVRSERFASTMEKFVSAVRRGIGRSGGWFDKFTGRVSREHRPTEEYPNGQEVYLLTFEGDDGPEPWAAAEADPPEVEP
jgi:hypothetical protein